MKLLDKAAILAADDLQSEIVSVPEWGGEVRLRGMTAGERDAFEMSIHADGGLKRADLRARLVSFCLVDANGVRLFAEADIAALSGKSAKPLDRLFDVAQRLAGIGDNEVKALAKN